MWNEILESLAARTDGSCALGVVGPAQCGKSTFVRRFASVALPSAEPEEGEALQVQGEIPCGEKQTLHLQIKERKGETALKGISSDCTAAIVIVSDGSIGDVARSNQIEAEEQIVKALSGQNIPFVLLINSKDSKGEECAALRASLEEKYAVPVCCADCAGGEDFQETLENLLQAFPVSGIEIDLPDWICVLPQDSKIVADILSKVREISPKITRVWDCGLLEKAFSEGDVYCASWESDVSTGRAHYALAAKEGMFYAVLSEECGAEIGDDLRLMAYVRSLRDAKVFYEKFKKAMDCADEYGYGVVMPMESELALQAPELYRKGTKCGIKLKADATSYHIIKVDIHSEVSPIAGETARGEQIAKGVVESYEKDPEALWNTDMFGKTFKDMVKEGLDEKSGAMTEEVRGKLRKAVTRIVNEGRGGVLCILL